MRRVGRDARVGGGKVGADERDIAVVCLIAQHRHCSTGAGVTAHFHIPYTICNLLLLLLAPYHLLLTTY